MANKQIKVRLVRDNAKLPVRENGNWYDCFVSGVSVVRAHNVKGMNFNVFEHTSAVNTTGITAYNTGDIIVVHLGFAADIGENYEGHLLPRSSTFTKKGLILTNSMGLIDDSYKGDDDEWLAVFYATRPGSIRIGDRVVQMTVERSNVFDIKEVDNLNNKNRGGYGTTGK